MTHTAPPPSAARRVRPNADYRWTRRKAQAFLEALAQCGEVAAAARHVGMSRQSAYRLRARLGPGVFDDGWRAAQRVGRLNMATRMATDRLPR